MSIKTENTKRTNQSDEKWFLGSEGCRFMKITNKFLISGTGTGIIFLWQWPLKKRINRQMPARLPYDLPVWGRKPTRFVDVFVNLPMMENSFVYNPERQEFINCIDANEKYLGIACGDCSAGIFDFNTLKAVKYFGAYKPMSNIALSEKYCAYSSREGCGLVNLEDFNHICEGDYFFGGYYLTNIILYKNWLFGTNFEKLIGLNLPQGEKFLEIQDEHEFEYISFDFPYLAACGRNGNILIYDVSAQKTVFKTNLDSNLIIGISIKNKYLAVADYSGIIWMYNLDDTEKVLKLHTTIEMCNQIALNGNDLIANAGILEIWRDVFKKF